MDPLSKVELYKRRQSYIRLTRERGEFKGFERGYIIASAPDFLLLRKTHDISTDGYCIIPTNTITQIQNNKSDRFFDMIMKLEGIVEKKIPVPDIDLSGMKTIFQGLKKTGLTITTECEEPHLDYFCIGKIVRVGEKQVSQLYFTPDGILDEEPTVTKYSNITKISFGDMYAHLMTKYLKNA